MKYLIILMLLFCSNSYADSLTLYTANGDILISWTDIDIRLRKDTSVYFWDNVSEQNFKINGTYIAVFD